MDVSKKTTGEKLQHRLSRSSSRAGQIGCSLAIGLLLGGIGVPVVRYPSAHPQESGLWLMYVVGGLFTALSILLLYAAAHQLFASKTPETVVEIETLPLKRGSKVRLFVRQPGPLALESLRANLVGDEFWTVTIGSRRNHQSRHLDTINFFDSGEVDVPADMPLERMITLDVPRDIQRSGTANERTTKWKIEVWGKVRGRADFMHPYDVEVV